MEWRVKLEFTINEVGGVDDVVVIDANPKRVFDREAKRALGKWKFKPEIGDGCPVKIYGLSPLMEFKLG
jgi:protein TonB